ncbi:MAG: transcriptional regulator NrdR [Phycisphaerae bacterium]|nr:transcriptional regulator NrdR [Phycisphaerae bacterium]
MQCPFCKEQSNDKVIDSRATEAGRVIRRRRQCLACGKRYTTYERIEETIRLMVVKKDGNRAPYDRAKIFAGMQRACWKRPVSDEMLQRAVDEVEDEIFRRFDREVSSRTIGALAANRLRQLDPIAYIRFASIDREFQEVGDFIQEAQDVLDESLKETPGQQELFDE